MNNYQDGGTSHGKIIPIKHHFVSLIFVIVSPLVRSDLPDKYFYETSKPKLLYVKQHILYKSKMYEVTKIIVYHRFAK